MGGQNTKNICESKLTSSSALKLFTFGDSILDCGVYNKYNITPAKLLVRNNDELFPEFKEKTLSDVLKREVILNELAVDGSIVDNLPGQILTVKPDENAIALLTIGGNDMLGGLMEDKNGKEIDKFEQKLKKFLQKLPIGHVFIGSIYDPTFGDDSKNFTNVEPSLGRANQKRINGILKKFGEEYGAFVDIYDHFIKNGDFKWLVHVIEPSITGASEIRRLYLDAIIKYYMNK